MKELKRSTYKAFIGITNLIRTPLSSVLSVALNSSKSTNSARLALKLRSTFQKERRLCTYHAELGIHYSAISRFVKKIAINTSTKTAITV